MKYLFLTVFIVLAGCANKNCREYRNEEAAKAGLPAAEMSSATPSATSSKLGKENDPMSKTALADRVRVYKPDGSLQCGMGTAISISVMQKQLGDIKVHRTFSKHDGLMRPQVCGAPTGNCNVYEIDRKDLAAAQKAGFKEWTFE